MHACSERALQTLFSPKRYRTKYLKVVSSHWESFLFICLRNDIVWNFLMSCATSWSLFVCITQRFSATVLTYSHTHLLTVLTYSRYSHLRYVEVNCTWQSIFPHFYCWEKLIFELCKHGSHFSLLRILLKLTPLHWIKWVPLRSLPACCDKTFKNLFPSKKYHNCHDEKYFRWFS